MEEEKQSILGKFKSFSLECRRVLKVTKRPSKLEFKSIVTVTGIGIAIIGFLGFVIQMVKLIFFK